MAAIPDSARRVLEGRALAHLVTLEPDGTPQVSIVWIGLDGDEIVAAHLPEHRKVRNIRRDPRVTLSVEAGTRNEIGLVNTSSFMAARGSLRGVLLSCFSSLLEPISAPMSSFPPMDDPPPGYITHITVDRIGGVGPWSR